MAKAVIEIIGESQGLEEVKAKLDALTQKEKELIAQMDSISKQKQQWQGAAKVVAEFDKEIAKTTTELKQTRKSIDELSEAQKKMPGEVVAKNAEKSFRALRRELTEQLTAMKLAGQTGTEEYEKLVQKLGEMTDAAGDVSREVNEIASDTVAFDTVLEGTQLMAGGFSVAQGAAALFGVEGERLQEIMVKLQSAIAITTGLQQIQNVVQKESNIMRGISAMRTAAAAKAEAYKRLVTMQGTGATIGATIAQKAFNAAAKTNPYIWLAAALITVVGALVAFSSGSKKAAEEQERLISLQERHFNNIETGNEKTKKASSESIADMQREISILEAQGGKEKEIQAIRQKIIDERRSALEKQKQDSAVELFFVEENKKKVKELEIQLHDLNNMKDLNKKVSVTIEGQTSKEKASEQIDRVQKAIDALKKPIILQAQLETESKDTDAEQEKLDADKRQKAVEAGKKSAQALADYRVLIAAKGSEEELKAQKNALQVKLKNELSNVNLTEGERTKLRGETQKAIEKLDDDYRKKQLQDAVAAIDAELAGEREFNIATLNLRSARLEAQKKLDLANAKDNKAKQFLIEKEHQAALIKLYDDYDKSDAQRTANTNQSNINARLAAVKAGSKEEHNLKVELLEESARAEIENAALSIQNEEERVAKIKEINAKLNRDKSDLDIEYIKSAEERSKEEVLAVTQQYEQRKMSRQEYENQLRNISIKSLEDEIAERKDKGAETVELEKELSEKRIEVAEQEKEARKQIFEELFSTMGEVANVFFDMQNQKLSQEMEDLNHYYTTDVEAARKNKELKLISEDEMARRQLEIKRKQAQAEKNQAIFNVLMSTGQAIMSSAQIGFPAAIPFVAMAAALGTVQLAAILSKPLPKYWKGRRGGKGEWALAGEYGPELMWIPAGASIMPNMDTQKALKGNTGMFDKWDMPRINSSIPTPFVSQKIINQYNQEHRREERIDYDKLGRAVAGHMKFPKQRDVSINFDKSGLSVTEGNTTTHFLNSKYMR